MKIAFLTTGCHLNLIQIRQIVAANPELFQEVNNPAEADIVVAAFCAISMESLMKYQPKSHELQALRKAHPDIRILAGGCIAHLRVPPTMMFADGLFRRYDGGEAFLRFIKEHFALQLEEAEAPFIYTGTAHITIQRGCRRRCSFCKTNYLCDIGPRSRPEDEILRLAEKAVASGTSIITLEAENATEYGVDIGSSLESLLKKLFELPGLRYVDVLGACLDEVTPEVLEILKHPKVRQIQLEVQSLNDMIRRSMRLAKTTSEALAILDELQGKALMSNLICGFPGASMSEFERELKLARRHHLYYLSCDPYDDTVGLPSHEIYREPAKGEIQSYISAHMREIAKERELVLQEIMAQESIEATVMYHYNGAAVLEATRYMAFVEIPDAHCRYAPGETVNVKALGLSTPVSPELLGAMAKTGAKTPAKDGHGYSAAAMESMQYFNIAAGDQRLTLKGRVMRDAEAVAV